MADHPHTIDRWDDATGENPIEQIAAIGDYLVALETYRAAVKRWPKDKITLRNRARGAMIPLGGNAPTIRAGRFLQNFPVGLGRAGFSPPQPSLRSWRELPHRPPGGWTRRVRWTRHPLSLYVVVTPKYLCPKSPEGSAPCGHLACLMVRAMFILVAAAHLACPASPVKPTRLRSPTSNQPQRA